MFNYPIKIAGELLLRFPALNKFLLNYRNESLRIVYYHMISEADHSYYLTNKAIPPSLLREQIRFFKKHFEIISLRQVIQAAKEKISLKRKLVITFDDGFRENYHIIAPILVDEKVRATFFLISNCIDNKDLMWRNKLLVINNTRQAKLAAVLNEFHKEFNLAKKKPGENILEWSFRVWEMKKKEVFVNFLWANSELEPLSEFLAEKQPYMTSCEINEIIREGFSIGTHSLSHPIFSKLDYDEFEEEVLGSVKILERVLNKKVDAFSYPFGLRAKASFEDKLTNKYPTTISTFLGTKNALLNTNKPIRWERDNLEFSNQEMVIRFSLLPIIRNIF